MDMKLTWILAILAIFISGMSVGGMIVCRIWSAEIDRRIAIRTAEEGELR